MVLREVVVLGAASVALGLLGAFDVTGLLRNYLFGIRPDDGLTFTAVSGLFLVVCLATGHFPARGAARIDLMVALRDEMSRHEYGHSRPPIEKDRRI